MTVCLAALCAPVLLVTSPVWGPIAACYNAVKGTGSSGTEDISFSATASDYYDFVVHGERVCECECECECESVKV